MDVDRRLPARATVVKIIVLAGSFAAFLYYGFINYPAIAPRDRDVAELIRQARSIGDAWRNFREDPKHTKPRELTSKFWSEGSADLEPYLGALPVPPAALVDIGSGYYHWIPVWVDDVAFLPGPRGYAPSPEQATSGFVIRLDPSRSDVCLAVAQASGQGKGIPHDVTGRGDWGHASNLGAGEFTCVWNDNRKTGQLAGSSTFLLYRVF
jgi:hypothetical protein